MGKYKVIYCNNCNRFHFRTAMNFEDGRECCPDIRCASSRISVFNCESFREMALIERKHKTEKPRRHTGHRFIYCNKCEQFYLNTSHDFGDGRDACPNIKCFSKDIEKFEVDSFQEMAQIERQYKIRKLNGTKKH